MKTKVQRVKNKGTLKEEYSYIMDKQIIEDVIAVTQLTTKRADINGQTIKIVDDKEMIEIEIVEGKKVAYKIRVITIEFDTTLTH